MLHFVRIKSKSNRPKKSQSSNDGNVLVYPEFLVKPSDDLMIKGKDFYAIWDEEAGLWSRKEHDVQRLVDKDLWDYYNKYIEAHPEKEGSVSVKDLGTFSTGGWTNWLRYKSGLPDYYHELDSNITFADQEVKKEDYVSKRLPYVLSDSPTPAYDELMGKLYDKDERQKLEWAIGSIFAGDGKKLQKFIVLYGEPGSGKGTVIDLIMLLFEGYCTTFDAKALTSSNNSFALEAFANNPLVAVEHDSKLSKIADNTKLNSVVSHEYMSVNEKFKRAYTSKFNAFLFLGSNTPVQITDSKSGLLRRLIDVSPTGATFSPSKYNKLKDQLQYELGGIASKCLAVYKELGFTYYNSYKPNSMLWATNDMYNFVLENLDEFSSAESITLTQAYALYQTYCKEANVLYPLSRRPFGEELKTYFNEFKERKEVYNKELGRNSSVRSVYSGLKLDRFDLKVLGINKHHEEEEDDWLKFKKQPSVLDEYLADYPAQYAELLEGGTDKPALPWSKCKTKLKDLDTHKLHYVKTPLALISMDFDLRDANGNKSLELNMKEARKWKPTYAEVSKSGGGIHLSYLYDGDPNELSRTIGPNIEVKVNVGNAALRRKLTLCNNLGIATISSGLPKKEAKSVVSKTVIKNEKHLRSLIQQAMDKKTNLPSTKSNVDWIEHILEEAYASNMKYDVTDLRPKVHEFASNSTNQSLYCIKAVNRMKFKSDEPSLPVDADKTDIVFFDIEIFKNLFVICWKFMGKDTEVFKVINPTPDYIERLMKFRLVGFNNRKYDNHMIYARLMGYTNEQLYVLSQRLINDSLNAGFSEAYNVSYADVYDFCSKKQSLKKWEIELGIHHQELGLPWDEPAPEDKWDLVAEYCANDVLATEEVFHARKEDFVAREILADLSGLKVNDTTRMHATKIIFGDDKHPELVYTDLSEMFPGYKFYEGIVEKEDSKTHKIKKVHVKVSTYMDEEVGEGGYVYAEPGFYGNVKVMDIASMHPHSIIELDLFGPYTKRFKDLVEARIAIKHHDYELAKLMFDGVLGKYLGNDSEADALAGALKIVINSVYGFTTATFDNPFKDPRNVDNIVAKRGALFMVNLKHEVQKRGYTVAHIKTDSIKIPDATPEIIQFIVDYGKKYGYTFEEEASYDKMCLVNDAVYVAKYKDGKHAGEWTATGTQFQVPYVFKTLFSREPIEFNDMCETKSVTTSMYLDFNEGLPEGEHNYVFVGRVGSFCPMVKGADGGILYRKKDDKYSAVTGTKGYRWLESEVVKASDKISLIDHRYYGKLVDAAVDTIQKYIDFDWFVSDEPYNGFIPYDLTNAMNQPEELPFK